jgi:hypothetical protein
LKEASLDNNGTILYLRTLGGTDIQTNGKNLITEQNARVVALWESALKELLRDIEITIIPFSERLIYPTI